MVALYRDLSGNNPNNQMLNHPTRGATPAPEYGAAITDPDSVDQEFDRMARQVYIATSGNVELVDWRGNSTIFVAPGAGTTLNVQASGSRAAGTTVTNIVPLY